MACFRGWKQFVIAIGTASGSAAQNLALEEADQAQTQSRRQVRVYAKGTDMVIKFGGGTVVADRSVTSNALADGNFVQAANTTEIYDLAPSDKFVSAQALDGATAGTCYITLGGGEGRLQT